MLEHGGQLHAAAQRYGIPAAEWLDLSTGINPIPFAPPPIPLAAGATGTGLRVRSTRGVAWQDEPSLVAYFTAFCLVTGQLAREALLTCS